MMKMRVVSMLLLCVLLCGALTLGAGAAEEIGEELETFEAEQDTQSLIEVFDKDGLLADVKEQEINEALKAASSQAGIPICAYVFASQRIDDGYQKYKGEQFLAEYGKKYGIDGDDALVLLVVSVTSREIYYDIYTYGDALYKINQKEVDYILDDSRVYDNIKNGRIAEGLCSYAELSAEAYAGRLGVSWQLILVVALIVGAIAGYISVKSIAASYKKKNPSQSYPLDRFAKLDLTRQNDREIGKFVTTTIISSGSRGGRGGGGMGGGGGHRGGR